MIAESKVNRDAASLFSSNRCMRQKAARLGVRCSGGEMNLNEMNLNDVHLEADFASDLPLDLIAHARRSAKCAPQKATAAPRQSAARPASTPDMVGVGLGADAAWPAPANTSTPTAMRNCRMRCGI